MALDTQRLQEVIETGIEHGVFIRDNHGFRFAHPLWRHAFYSRIEPLGRQRYHLQIAKTSDRQLFLRSLHAATSIPAVMQNASWWGVPYAPL